MRDFVTRTKEMLEGRIDQIQHFDEKIKNIKDEMAQTNKINDMCNKKIAEDIMNQEKNILNLTDQMRAHTADNKEKL